MLTGNKVIKNLYNNLKKNGRNNAKRLKYHSQSIKHLKMGL